MKNSIEDLNAGCATRQMASSYGNISKMRKYAALPHHVRPLTFTLIFPKIYLITQHHTVTIAIHFFTHIHDVQVASSLELLSSFTVSLANGQRPPALSSSPIMSSSAHMKLRDTCDTLQELGNRQNRLPSKHDH